MKMISHKNKMHYLVPKTDQFNSCSKFWLCPQIFWGFTLIKKLYKSVFIINLPWWSIFKEQQALTSWSPEVGRHCWHYVEWQRLSPASLLTGSSPLSFPGWWLGWVCGAVERLSVTAEDCSMSSATCYCCCGKGICTRRSHCHCCCPYILTQVLDTALSSPYNDKREISVCSLTLRDHDN